MIESSIGMTNDNSDAFKEKHTPNRALHEKNAPTSFIQIQFVN